MEITEVRIFPRESEDRKLKAYATITIDNAFVVRNVKVIEGNKGLFVAMPSRKLREACPKCNYKNAVRSRFCNQCGAALPQGEPSALPRGERKMDSTSEENGRQSGHRDIAHPITPECREYIQKKVLAAYESEPKGKRPFGGHEAREPRREPAGPEPKSKAPEPPPIAEITDEDFEGDLEL